MSVSVEIFFNRCMFLFFRRNVCFRILPCGHSLCGPQSEENCLLEWESRQEVRGVIMCPICRKNHQVR